LSTTTSGEFASARVAVSDKGGAVGLLVIGVWVLVGVLVADNVGVDADALVRDCSGVGALVRLQANVMAASIKPGRITFWLFSSENIALILALSGSGFSISCLAYVGSYFLGLTAAGSKYIRPYHH